MIRHQLSIRNTGMPNHGMPLLGAAVFYLCVWLLLVAAIDGFWHTIHTLPGAGLPGSVLHQVSLSCLLAALTCLHYSIIQVLQESARCTFCVSAKLACMLRF